MGQGAGSQPAHICEQFGQPIVRFAEQGCQFGCTCLRERVQDKTAVCINRKAIGGILYDFRGTGQVDVLCHKPQRRSQEWKGVRENVQERDDPSFNLEEGGLKERLGLRQSSVTVVVVVFEQGLVERQPRQDQSRQLGPQRSGPDVCVGFDQRVITNTYLDPQGSGGHSAGLGQQPLPVLQMFHVSWFPQNATGSNFAAARINSPNCSQGADS